MIMFYKHGYIYYIKIIPPPLSEEIFFPNILLVDAVEGGWVSGRLNIYIYISDEEMLLVIVLYDAIIHRFRNLIKYYKTNSGGNIQTQKYSYMISHSVYWCSAV